MSEDKDRQFLEQLVEATQQGRISWEPTANLDEFTSSFRGKYSVVVAKRGANNYTLRMLDDSEREMLKLEYEDEGYAPPPGQGLPRIQQLFELARRTGLHVEEAIADILEELKK